MPLSHKVVGYINLFLFPILVFLIITLSKVMMVFSTKIGLVAIILLAIFLNIGATLFFKYYGKKPYVATTFEKGLLWISMINALMMTPFYFILFRGLIG